MPHYPADPYKTHPWDSLEARHCSCQENQASALASAEKHKVWGEALAAKLRAAGTDLAVLEAERIAALWKAEAPLRALQQRAEQLQARAAAVEKQVRPIKL